MLRQTYKELQQIRPQYTFGDVDIDRYKLDDRVRQVVLSARELDLDNLPSQTWQNRHLVYTHGYGLVASPSNGVLPDGSPEFLVKDIPPQSTQLEINQPAIYYGEKLPGYAFVDTTQKEFDYPREGTDAATTYAGKGGVKVGNILRRAALFLRFGDVKVLISSQITPNSKALYLRDVRDRVRKAAPFLKYDADPYPVLLNGRIIWVIDAYTVTDRYPYAQAYTRRRPAHRRQRAADPAQLRPQLDQGHGRRLRRHGQVLRLRRSGQPRPDREGLPEGVPQALHRPVADAGRPRRPPPLPGGPLPGAGRPLRRLPRDRPGHLLPQLPAVGGGPGSGVGDRGSPPRRRRLRRRRRGGPVAGPRSGPGWIRTTC